MFESFEDDAYAKYLKEDKEAFDRWIRLNPAIDAMWTPISKEEFLKRNEDTSATGGAPSTGMGAIVSAQPSSLAGVTSGQGGGTVGSGDISVPFNPGGGAKMSQKIPAMGYNHGPRTGKKSRVKKLDLRQIRNSLKNRKDFTHGQTSGKKVMSFDSFKKDDVNKITKLKENVEVFKDLVEPLFIDMIDNKVVVKYKQKVDIINIFEHTSKSIIDTRSNEFESISRASLDDITNCYVVSLSNVNDNNYNKECLDTANEYLESLGYKFVAMLYTDGNDFDRDGNGGVFITNETNISSVCGNIELYYEIS